MSAHIAIAGTDRVLADRAEWARSGPQRRRGLLGRAGLEPGEGLIIERSPQVHTLGMEFPIDVVFASKAWVVKHVVRSMAPGRMSRFVFGARYAIELPAGTVGSDVERGDTLVVTELSN